MVVHMYGLLRAPTYSSFVQSSCQREEFTRIGVQADDDTVELLLGTNRCSWSVTKKGGKMAL